MQINSLIQSKKETFKDLKISNNQKQTIFIETVEFLRLVCLWFLWFCFGLWFWLFLQFVVVACFLFLFFVNRLDSLHWTALVHLKSKGAENENSQSVQVCQKYSHLYLRAQLTLNKVFHFQTFLGLLLPQCKCSELCGPFPSCICSSY